MTARSTWKANERKAAGFFGSVRNRCSGSSGRSDLSRSDSTNERIYVETKTSKRSSLHTLFRETEDKAAKEGKIPILQIFRTGDRRGPLITLRPEHLLYVAFERLLAMLEEALDE